MMSDETLAMRYIIKDDAEAENMQAYIWNTSVNYWKSTAFQSHGSVSPKYSVAEAPW